MGQANGGYTMETPFDWITLAIFGGLIVLFLDRSSKPDPPDHLWQYMIPSVGCAVANYAGNHGQPVIAVLMIVAILAYIQLVLKPFGAWPRR